MTVDPRAARTRRRIADAVLELAADGGSAVTVAAVARSAGVNRSSVYAHFASVEDIACWMLDESFTQIADLGRIERSVDIAGDSAGAQRRRDLLALIEHVAGQREFYRVVLTSGDSSARAQLHVAELLGKRFEDLLIDYGALSVTDEVGVTAAAIGVGAGLVALIGAWLSGDLDCTEEALAARCAEVFPAWTSSLPIVGATRAPVSSTEEISHD